MPLSMCMLTKIRNQINLQYTIKCIPKGSFTYFKSFLYTNWEPFYILKWNLSLNDKIKILDYDNKLMMNKCKP